MRRNACSKEFLCKKFGFGCTKEESETFYVSQWGRNRTTFFIYRLVMALHSLGWSIGFYVWCKVYCRVQMEHSYRYITLWADFLRTGYFILAAILVLIGLEHKREPLKDQGFVKWLRMAVWLLFNIAISSNATVALLFWPFVAPELEPIISRSALNIFLHAMNFVLMVVDLSIVAFPIRLLHAVYSMLLAAVYCVCTLILWKSGDTHAVYSILDWKNNPGPAGGFFLAAIMIGAPIIQTLTFGLYLLRKYCYSRFRRWATDDAKENVENVALNDDHQTNPS